MCVMVQADVCGVCSSDLYTYGTLNYWLGMLIGHKVKCLSSESSEDKEF